MRVYCGIGCIALRILNLGTRCTHWIGLWVGPRAGMAAVTKKKISSLLLPGIEPWNPNRLTRSLVAIPTELSRLLFIGLLRISFSFISWEKEVNCRKLHALNIINESGKSLFPDDGGSMDLRNGAVLPHHYTVSDPRRPRLESASPWLKSRESNNTWFQTLYLQKIWPLLS
jgi:hypothetical protein